MVKLPEESMGKELVDVGLGNNFWYMTTEAQATKAKTNRRGYIRLKPLAQQTPSQQDEKATYRRGGILANHLSF